MTAERAIADLKKALAQEPNDTRALVRLAEQHVKAGQPQIACEVYARAGDVLVKQGFARRALSAFAQAMECARAQVATHERVAPIARAMAKLLVKEKLVREAVAALDSSAKFLVERGADGHAIRLLEERVAIDDADVARVRLAEALFRVGEIERAADELTAVYARLHESGARDEAIEVGERLLHHRRDAVVARECAEMYLARNRPGDAFLALAKLRVCCDKDARHVPTLELLATAFDKANHPDKATRVRREIAIIVGKDAPTLSVAAAPPKKDDSMARVDAGWEELAKSEKVIDMGRPSFWQVPDAELPDDSVVSVSLEELEVIDGAAPPSHERATILETALECVDSLVAQGRYAEAESLVAKHLEVRPNNPLLLDRKSEIEEMRNGYKEGPPPALFGQAKRRDSERSIPTTWRAASA